MCRRSLRHTIAAPEQDIGWLVDWRDRIALGESLDSNSLGSSNQVSDGDCERLTRGFIACNLIVDLVDFLGSVLHRSPGAVLLDVSYADIDDWMVSAALPAAAAERLQSSAAYEESLGSDPHHPWRRTNRWLALESVLRRAQGQRGPGSVSVSEQARRTFGEPFPSVSLEPVAACQTRFPQVQDAFQRWFDQSANCLAGLLEETILPARHDLAESAWRERLTGVLAEGLCLDPMVSLVKAKNEQLRSCVARLNRGEVHYPVESGWVANISGRIYQAQQARQDFWWGRLWHRYTGRWLGRLVSPGTDCFNLGALLDWLQAHPDAEQTMGRPVETTVLWEVSARCPITVPWGQLGVILDELEAITRLVRRRGLPTNWGEMQPVCDLFFHPLSGAAGPAPGVLESDPSLFSFGQWYNDVTVS